MKARCYRSMKKNEKPHMMQIVFRKQDQSDIVSFSCSCAAGQGFCHHIVGFVFQLAHYKILGLKTIPPVLSKTFLPLFLAITANVLKDFSLTCKRLGIILHLLSREEYNQEWQSIRSLIDIKRYNVL